MARQRVVSGIRTSGELHLGNYLGALQRFIGMQEDYDCYFFLADLHGLTTIHDRKKLQRYIRHTAEVYLACGLDPERVVFFRQSAVPAHAELGWLLTTQATVGEFSRMTQFKEKSRGHARDSVGVGVFTYPALMAADILLYRPALVPVGDDQKQHVEITRDLAERFNRRFGPTLTVPEPLIRREGARIKALDDPAKKMSKSASSELSYIALEDSPEAIRKKIRRAVTDSGSQVQGGSGKPALTNLLTVYSLLTGRTVGDIEQSYAGMGYGEFKRDLAEVVVEGLAPIRNKLKELRADPGYVDKVLAEGSRQASDVASETLNDAKAAVGL